SVFIGDEDNNVVRAVQGSSGIIFSIAGTGIRGYNGDVGPATDARLNDPKGVFVDAKGDLYIADEDNHLIRRVEGVATPTVLKVGVYRGPTKPNLSVTATGQADFDGDGAVNFQDFLQFARRFGKRAGESEFDAAFDLDGNGAVDFPDFLIFAQSFGT
ncbi:MAG: EF-hand domain-containing protein, partial [bacterium]|nr:EF-hand domain-containing protein [bacterium]